MPKIFISYRRDDAAFAAHSIYEKLKDLFGQESITFDVNFSLGTDFARKIDESVCRSDVLLAIIGDRWLDIRSAEGPMQGQRRLDDPNDWVRLEIASALKKDILVVPVLVGKVTIADITAGVPPDLADLTNKVAISVRAGPDLPNDLHLLVRGIKRAIRLSPLTPTDLALPAGVKVVPQGLRSFGEKDDGFFIYLLPGPYQADGLTEKLCFWKTRIEAADPNTTFRVGLIYGPSGCGKSSLVKAGLLPRLGEHVTVVYVEATATDAEARLLAALHEKCPYLGRESNLLAALRHKDRIASDKKVLMVLDQFEQYLHSASEEEQDELAEALGECDGGKLQCLLMARDDFLTPVNRFMQRLQIPLAENQNLALVDLFDRRHAKKVLALLGQAYGGLPSSGSLRKDQDAFLNQAITELAEGEHVISVRLALFAQMFEGKEWKPATLKAIGGAAGVGVAFLEDSLVAKTDLWKNRGHSAAAQRVLGALLPEPGTTIKGAMRTREELLKKSGYAVRPEEFDQIIEILDTKLRLVTPTDPAFEVNYGQPQRCADAERRYQLTHDFLVPSLREWLTSKKKETLRGRAELRLAERSELWNAKPENRHLPSLWEYLNIRLLTGRWDWSGIQRKMMGKAGRLHGIRSGIVASVIAVMCLTSVGIRNALVEKQNATRAEGLVDALARADIAQVPSIIADLGKYRAWADPLLKAKFAQTKEDSSERLDMALALLPVDATQVQYVYQRLLDATPSEFPVIRDALAPQRDELVEKLWTVAEKPAQGRQQQRLRAAAALAAYAPNDQRWAKVAGAVADDLVNVPVVYLTAWMDALRAVRGNLLSPLSLVFQDAKRPEIDRSLATDILADYAANQPNVLADLVMNADEKQFAIVFAKLKQLGDEGVPLLQAEIKKAIPDANEDAKEALVKRQAIAAVALLKMNHAAEAWPLLKHSPDPRLRTCLIHCLAPLAVDVTTVVHRLDEETDASIRRALILCLGEFNAAQFPAARRQPLIVKLLALYRNDPDPGLHGAAEWLLRQKGWDQAKELAEIDVQLQVDEKQLRASKATNKRQWYVNRQGQTFVILNADQPFLMGSPESEPGRNKDEVSHQQRIGRTFAIAAKIVTKAQYRKFQKANRDVWSREIEQWSRTDDSPQVGETWYEAARYCNWLSECEGIPKGQWCYEPNEQGKYAEGMKPAPAYLKRSGYRLPTEAEWEYACRSASQTSRYYGQTANLLAKYAWFLDNADSRLWPVGIKKPNDFGLFDIQGNAWQWCDSSFVIKDGSTAEDLGDTARVRDKVKRVLRGCSFDAQVSNVRSASRGGDVPTDRLLNTGFRPARTYN